MLQAQQDAQIAQEHAGKASAALSAELKQKQRLQSLPNYILEGQTASGEPLAIKIAGSDIGASGEGLVIGRNPDAANIILNLEEISRQQFRLLFLGDQLMIEDLDSTNGTQLNGELLTPYQPEVIFPGAVIDIAGLQMTIRTT